MPNATISTEGERHDLKTCEGAFVIIKPLSYGQLLKRRDMAFRSYSEVVAGQNNTDTTRMYMDIANETTRRFDFATCILDHNLEDKNGQKLNFNNSMTFDVLDPKVAAEIEIELDKLNLDDTLDTENFTGLSDASSTKISNNSSEVVEDTSSVTE